MKPITKYILAILGTCILAFLLWYFQSIVWYLVISGILSLIGDPLVSRICRINIRNFRPGRTLGAAITLILLWTFILTSVIIFVPAVVEETNTLSNINVSKMMDNFQEPLQKVQEVLGKTYDDSGREITYEEYASQKIISFLDFSHITDFLRYFAGTIGNIFISFFSISFISFFFLKDNKLFSNSLLTIIPAKYVDETQNVIKSVSKLLKRYFIGIGIEIVSVTTLVTIGLSIIGFKLNHILIVAVFAGVINVIPYIGPIIGGLFGIFIGIITHLNLDFYSELLPLIGLTGLVFISVQVIDNVVFQPLIYSSSVHAHPLEIFLVILIAGNLAGIVGMVLAIPTYTILRVIAKEFFHRFKIVKSLTKNI